MLEVGTGIDIDCVGLLQCMVCFVVGVLAVTDVNFDLSQVTQCLTSVNTALKQSEQALRSLELQDGAGTRTTDFSIL